MTEQKGKLRVLVTGASGTVGKEVVSQLLRAKDKYAVSVFDLKTKDSPFPSGFH